MFVREISNRVACVNGIIAPLMPRAQKVAWTILKFASVLENAKILQNYSIARSRNFWRAEH